MSTKEKERYEILKSFVSSDRFFEKYKNQKVDIETDDIIYSIDVENYRNTFLAFPTREMRDAFYENFKELIDTVKELL